MDEPTKGEGTLETKEEIEIITQENVKAPAETNDTEKALEEEPIEDAPADTTIPPLPVQKEPSSGTDEDEPSAQPAVFPPETSAINYPEQSPHDKETASVALTPEQSRASFVNEGLLRWEAARHEWLGGRGSDDSSSARPTAVPLDVDRIIDVLFHASTRETRTVNSPPEQFPRPVPLPQMVDILQDLWEAEGLDA